jgi:hypothetical protein
MAAAGSVPQRVIKVGEETLVTTVEIMMSAQD